MNVKLDDLELALDYASADPLGEALAFIDMSSGAIIYTGDSIDEEEYAEFDLEDETRFLPVPDKRELDLGRELVFEFIDDKLPDQRAAVRDIFHYKGAYARYKALLERSGQLDAWHEYEKQATIKALRRWCEENGVLLV